jgi:hypothetical protein
MKDKIHNQFILQNNNIDVGKFSGLQGGCCSDESPDYYIKQNHKFVMSFQRFIYMLKCFVGENVSIYSSQWKL